MRFMNRWEVEDAVEMYADHPILGPATQTLDNLMRWTDSHSDGWAYWPKPVRAAARLMELIENDKAATYRGGLIPEVTIGQYKAALRPIKAFRTRQNADFVIVDAEVAIA
jgi:hypothetical protein